MAYKDVITVIGKEGHYNSALSKNSDIVNNILRSYVTEEPGDNNLFPEESVLVYDFQL